MTEFEKYKVCFLSIGVVLRFFSAEYRKLNERNSLKIYENLKEKAYFLANWSNVTIF